MQISPAGWFPGPDLSSPGANTWQIDAAPEEV